MSCDQTETSLYLGRPDWLTWLAKWGRTHRQPPNSATDFFTSSKSVDNTISLLFTAVYKPPNLHDLYGFPSRRPRQKACCPPLPTIPHVPITVSPAYSSIVAAPSSTDLLYPPSANMVESTLVNRVAITVVIVPGIPVCLGST
jgi:hypothetical protein